MSDKLINPRIQMCDMVPLINPPCSIEIRGLKLGFLGVAYHDATPNFAQPQPFIDRVAFLITLLFSLSLTFTGRRHSHLSERIFCLPVICLISILLLIFPHLNGG